MAIETTATSELTLFAGMSLRAYGEAMDANTLSPHHFMVPQGGRAWIPLNKDIQPALGRTIWGAEERGEFNLNPKRNFCLVRITFTALGFGHYYLAGKLTTSDWVQWRFHGDLGVPTRDADGRFLANVTHVFAVE